MGLGSPPRHRSVEPPVLLLPRGDRGGTIPVSGPNEYPSGPLSPPPDPPPIIVWVGKVLRGTGLGTESETPGTTGKVTPPRTES